MKNVGFRAIFCGGICSVIDFCQKIINVNLHQWQSALLKIVYDIPFDDEEGVYVNNSLVDPLSNHVFYGDNKIIVFTNDKQSGKTSFFLYMILYKIYSILRLPPSDNYDISKILVYFPNVFLGSVFLNNLSSLIYENEEIVNSSKRIISLTNLDLSIRVNNQEVKVCILTQDDRSDVSNTVVSIYFDNINEFSNDNTKRLLNTYLDIYAKPRLRILSSDFRLRDIIIGSDEDIGDEIPCLIDEVMRCISRRYDIHFSILVMNYQGD